MGRFAPLSFPPAARPLLRCQHAGEGPDVNVCLLDNSSTHFLLRDSLRRVDQQHEQLAGSGQQQWLATPRPQRVAGLQLHCEGGQVVESPLLVRHECSLPCFMFGDVCNHVDFTVCKATAMKCSGNKLCDDRAKGTLRVLRYERKNVPSTMAQGCIQVCTFHDGCKQGIDQQFFNRKSISREITHPQS